MLMMFIEPRVSKSRGWKGRFRDEYFAGFLAAACSAVPPGLAQMGKKDSASVLTTVTSHAIDLPTCHGISVLPSGRLPSSLTNPDGSLTDGTLALHRTRHTRSLTSWWRAIFPKANGRKYHKYLWRLSSSHRGSREECRDPLQVYYYYYYFIMV